MRVRGRLSERAPEQQNDGGRAFFFFFGPWPLFSFLCRPAAPLIFISLASLISYHLRYTGMLLINASLSSSRTAGPSGLEGVDSKRRRLDPHPRDVRVSMPVVGFLPSAYRHSAICWVRSRREEEKSALCCV